MNFILKKEDLLKPLQPLVSVANNKSTMPVLSCILFNYDGENLNLISSNMDIEIICKLPIKINDEFKIAISAKKIFNILRSLNDGADVKFEINNSIVNISSEGSKFKLISLDADKFPILQNKIESRLTFKIKQNTLLDLINTVDFSVPQDDVRYYLNGMLWELDCNLFKVVSTDGHRMSISETIVENNNLEEKIQSIVPKRTISELNKIITKTDNEVSIIFDKNFVRILVDNYQFTSKIIDGKYPDYNKVIPQNNTKKLSVDRIALKHDVIKTAILSNEKFKGIRLLLDNNLVTLSANNPEQESAESKLEAYYADEKMEICFNYKYLMDILNVLDEEVVDIYLNNANTSALIKGENNSIFVLMPMKI